MTKDFLIVFRHFDELLGGLWNTVWLAGATVLVASILGCAMAAPMLARQTYIRKSVSLLVDGMRCIPFLLLAYLVYYGLPELGLRFDSWTCGVTALVLYHSAYIAEIVRGAWSNLAREQIDAGKAFGFHGYPLFRRLILPQLFYASAPVIGNQTVQIVKDTAFLMIITVPELTFVASAIQATYFVPFASFIVAMLLYWAVTLVIEAGVRRVEFSAALRRAG
jgi:polar amino acid transport system permease protein